MNLSPLFLSVLMVTSGITYAQQNVGIGTPAPHESAVLEVSSTDKGMLVPRMNFAAITGIASPAEGLLVYCTSDSAFYTYKTVWTKVNYRNSDHPSFNTGFFASNKFAQFVIGGSGGPGEPFKKVCFDTVHFNSGNYYSKIDSQYVVPVAGVYHFDVKITSSQNTTAANTMVIQLRINNTDVKVTATGAQANGFPSGQKYYNADISINIKLEQADTVSIWARPSDAPLLINSSSNPCVNYFTGYRLY
jgi:hypothetical protein